jgi:hypothetical protein
VISLNCSKDNLAQYVYKLFVKEKDVMIKNTTNDVPLTLELSVMHQPISNIFTAYKSQGNKSIWFGLKDWRIYYEV